MDLAPILTGAALLIIGSAATLAAGEVQARRRRRETIEDTQAAWERQRQADREAWLRDRRMDLYVRYQSASHKLLDALVDATRLKPGSSAADRYEAALKISDASNEQFALNNEVVMLVEQPIHDRMHELRQAFFRAMKATSADIDDDFEKNCDTTRETASDAFFDVLAAIRAELGVTTPDNPDA